MAIIRRELQGRSGVSNCFDAICETEADLQSQEAQGWVSGSMVACLNTDLGKSVSFYCKGNDGTWRRVIE